jgi:hypothetical protein
MQLETQVARPDKPQGNFLFLSRRWHLVGQSKEIEVVSLNGYAHDFTTLADRASRVYVTVNPDYYDRSQPKSVPQHILIRLRHGQATLLNSTGIGARHLASFQTLREIVRANLTELRATVK